MVQKMGDLFGSIRFWVIILSAVVAILNGNPFLDTIQVALAAVVTIGSIDSAAIKFSSKREEK